MEKESYIRPSTIERSANCALLSHLGRWSVLLACSLFFGTSLFAGDFKVQAGAGITTQILPLAGFDLISGYKADESSLPFLPDHRSEFSFTYHNLSGNGQVSSTGNSGTTSVTFIGYELDYFMNFKFGNLSIGPGIGYGVAETTDSSTTTGGNNLGDPSPFFTANDIHYGTLMLRVSKQWSGVSCDGIGNSFGGLIGGSIVCGVEF